MAKYGAKYLRWAPFAETEPDADAAAFPKYGDPISLGSLVKVTDSPASTKRKPLETMLWRSTSTSLRSVA